MTTGVSFKKREIKEGVQGQGEGESVVYALTTTNWMVGPESATAMIERYNRDSRQFVDVTATYMTGSCSVVGDVVTLPVISGLEEGETYLVSVEFTKGLNTLSAVAWIVGEH